MAILETQGLSKTYGKGETTVHAIRSVDLQIEQGLTSIVGRSGSGKSTLLRLLGGLDRPTSGKVLLEGKDLYALTDDALAAVRRRRIGFVFQDFQLLPEYTVRDNILTPLYLDKREADAAYMHEIIEALGIADQLDKRPWQLSGGEQQRAAVARALAAQPAIVLADEPTGNLDMKTGEMLFVLLQRIVHAFDKTVVYVTHDMTLARQADKMVEILDGRIV